MAKNQSVILITIEAVLPMGDTVDQGFRTMEAVQNAQATNDWTKILDKCHAVDVTTKLTRRRLDAAQPEGVAQ